MHGAVALRAALPIGPLDGHVPLAVGPPPGLVCDGLDRDDFGVEGDAVAQAESGLMSVTGAAGGPAVRLGVAIADIATGMFAFQGMLLALIARATTGRGQLVDVGLLDAATALLTYQASRYFATGEIPARAGNRHMSIAPYDTFDTADSVWVANGGDDTVTQIDRSSGEVVRTVGVGRRPLGIAVGLGAVWVTSYDDDTLTVLDSATGARSGPAIPVGHQPRGVAVAAGGIWVANAGDGTVTRLDARTATEIGSPTPVGRDPRDLAVRGSALWVAAAGDDQVVRIDARSGRPGRPIAVGDDPIGIAVGRRAVWTANYRDGTLSRIRLR